MLVLSEKWPSVGGDYAHVRVELGRKRWQASVNVGTSGNGLIS